jgi:hypothetical protein
METIDTNNHFGVPEEKKRPKYLKVLCILTFISAGLSLLSSLINLISGPPSAEAMEDQNIEIIKAIDELKSLEMNSFVTLLEQIQRMTASVNAQFYSVTFVSVLVVLIGLFGALSMWKGKKIGFHLYIIYSLFSIIQIYFFVSPADIPMVVVVWNLIVSTIFVLFYSRHLKWLQ